MKLSTKWVEECGARFFPVNAHFGMAPLPGYMAEYLRLGRGEPLVLVPGLAGGYGLLGRLARLLAQDFEVITYELRWERSPCPVGPIESLETLADDLSDLMDYLRLERPAVLAVSFGTAVALELAIRQPGRLKALVLQGADTRFRSSLINTVGRELLRRIVLPHDSPFVNQFFRLLFGRKDEAPGLVDFVTRRCWGTDQGVMARRLAMLEGVDFEDRLDGIQVPTLVLAGELDLIASAEGQRTLASRIPEAELVTIPRAGHLAFLTRPKTVARLACQFLRQASVCSHRNGHDDPVR